MKTKQTKMQKQADWINSLPPVLLERAQLCAVERKVPLELPLMVGLAAVAASVGSGVEVRSGKNRRTRANLYILLGVSSGIGKSEVFRDMLGPLMDFENGLHSWWDKEPSVKARAGEELLKARLTNFRACIRKYPTANSMALFKDLQATERKRSICREYLKPPCLLADDSTCEALAQLMVRSNESIATVSADARYFLKRLSIPNTKEESFFLKAFSGDLALTNRVSRNSVRLRAPCLTALLLTQQDAYQGFIEKANLNRSGLLPRFLHASIDHQDSQPVQIDRRSESRIRTAYAEAIRGLIEGFRFDSGPELVDTAKDTRKYLSQIEEACRDAASYDESIASEILRRRAEQIWRVSLCLHLARHGRSSLMHPLCLEDAQVANQIVESCTNDIG